jgi:DNA-binding transcriptional LysR family regulator
MQECAHQRKRTSGSGGIVPMEMHQIRYFLAVARTLNFTRAAEECHVTQPALTRAIHHLEGELGGDLLRRERTLTHLTELGQRMLPLMQQCYDSALSAKSLAQSISSGHGDSLAIGISRTLDLALLTTPLAELSRICSNLQLKARRGSGLEIVEFLKKGEVELALAAQLGRVWERLDTWPLFTEPFELIVERGHWLATHNLVEPGHLSEEPLLIQSESEMAEEFSLYLSGQGIITARAHQVTTVDDLVALAEAGLGVAIVPASTRRSERLRTVPLKGLDITRTIAVYAVAGRKRSSAAAILLNLLRAADWSRYLPERALLSAPSRLSIDMRRR